MPKVIRVRDIARTDVYNRGPEEPVLRGPHDLFRPFGPVHRRGDLVDWVQAGAVRTARVVPGSPGDVHLGERFLLRLPPTGESDDQWWRCDVEAVDGVAATI